LSLSEVMDKVRKILAIASRSDNPGEIAAAQSMAQKLITQYQIDEASLGAISDDGIMSHRVDMEGPYISDKSVLLNAIALPNFCKVLRGSNYCLIFGYASDIELCVTLYESLVIHMVSEMTTKLDQYKKSSTNKTHTQSWIKSFFSGYAVSIRERIKEAKEGAIKEADSTGTSVALVLRDKQHAIEDYWQSLVSKKPNKKVVKSLDGYKAGIASGAQANLQQTQIESE